MSKDELREITDQNKEKERKIEYTKAVAILIAKKQQDSKQENTKMITFFLCY